MMANRLGDRIGSNSNSILFDSDQVGNQNNFSNSDRTLNFHNFCQ